jgi:hypothetical protein
MTKMNPKLTVTMVVDFMTSSAYDFAILNGCLSRGSEKFLMEQYGYLPGNPDLRPLAVDLANASRATFGVTLLLYRSDPDYQALLLQAAARHYEEILKYGMEGDEVTDPPSVD